MVDNIIFEDFLSAVLQEDFVIEVADRVKCQHSEVKALMHCYANEAQLGYSLVQPYLHSSKCLLEVGAGVGLLSTYLQQSGYTVKAIEPSGAGFELNYAIGFEIRRLLGVDANSFLDLRVEDLSKETVGQFDVIYSVNVLEHLPNLELAFQGMQAVMKPEGFMVHTCPNYHIPYEPHFGILLIPFFPGLSKYLLHRKITATGLWQSLNFITSTGIKRICKRQELNIKFAPKVMYRSLQRLDDDDVFAERHKGMVSVIYRVLCLTRLIYMVKWWPPCLSTPMSFFCCSTARES